MTALRDMVVLYASGNSTIVTSPRAYTNNYVSKSKAVIITFIYWREKKESTYDTTLAFL